MLNHHIWRRVFDEEFAPQLRGLVEALESRILPGFEGIDGEAERYSEELYQRTLEMPGTGDEDLSEVAEAANDAVVQRYLLLDVVRQGIVNLFAASLYHAFVQQVLMFHRREVLDEAEATDLKLFEMPEFCRRMLKHGIHIEGFKGWPVIDELRLVTNTVKHAEGKSAQRLHELRPDFFRRHGLPGLGEWVTRWKPQVFQPLVGKDLYVEFKDVKAYLQTLLEFWEELGVALERGLPTP